MRKKIIILIILLSLAAVIITTLLVVRNNQYYVEVSLVDTADNPARELVIKKNNKKITNAKEVKSEKGKIIDKSYPFTINKTSVDKMGDYLIIVLNDGRQIKVKVKK